MKENKLKLSEILEKLKEEGFLEILKIKESTLKNYLYKAIEKTKIASKNNEKITSTNKKIMYKTYLYSSVKKALEDFLAVRKEVPKNFPKEVIFDTTDKTKNYLLMVEAVNKLVEKGYLKKFKMKRKAFFNLVYKQIKKESVKSVMKIRDNTPSIGRRRCLYVDFKSLNKELDNCLKNLDS